MFVIILLRNFPLKSSRMSSNNQLSVAHWHSVFGHKET